MTRRPLLVAGPVLVAGSVWLAALAATGVVVLTARMPVLAHAYLAAWLVLVSLPLGALPVLMGLKLARRADHPLAAPLRLLLGSLPCLAVMVAPILLDLRDTYSWAPASTVAHAGPGYTGLGADWFTPLFFSARCIAYLVVWIALGLAFLRPARPSAEAPAGRRPLTGVGLAVHLLIGTLAGVDWFMSLDQAFVSSAYGTLVIAAQVAFALAVAVLMLLLCDRAPAAITAARSSVLALLVALAVAAFLQFTQYLVVWSANLPREIVWYQTRAQAGLGPVLVAAIPVLVTPAMVVLLPPRVGARPLPALLAVAALVLAATADMVWLTSPRDTLTGPLVLLDLVVMVAIGGVAALCAVLIGDRVGVRHG